MMLTYDSVTTKALQELPEFADKYNQLVSEGWLDSDDGVHIVFGMAFVPVLVEAIKTGETNVSERMLKFLEKMAMSDDHLVQEVCDFTVLEQLHDEVKDTVLYPLLGEKTKEGFLAISKYMLPN